MKQTQIEDGCISYTNRNDCMRMRQENRLPRQPVFCIRKGFMGLCIIGARDIRDYQNRRGAVVIDLRNPEEFVQFHIRGAVNVPVEKLEQYMKSAPRNRIFIFCCQHGNQSIQEGKRYVREGYQIYSLAGGMYAYRQIFRK